MRTTGKEIAEFCDEFLKGSGRTIAEMCRATGMKKEIFSMWKSHPSTVPRLDTLMSISSYLGLTVSQIIGQEETRYSDEITQALDMLSNLSPTALGIAVAMIKGVYDKERGEKTSTSSLVG